MTNLNEYIHSNKISELIRISEALHEKKIAQIADHIVESIEDLRLILIAGPSSSGKTTFASKIAHSIACQWYKSSLHIFR